jgi:NMD protein affecting ribosome stability and mRNA decay
MTGEVTIAPMPCRSCGVKRAQAPRGLCRACDVAAGTYVPRVAAPRVCRRCGRVSDTRASLCAACAVAPPVPSPPPPPPIRERVLGGVVYVVVWDGSRG